MRWPDYDLYLSFSDKLTIIVDDAHQVSDANSAGDLEWWYFDLELMLGGIQPGSLSDAYIDYKLYAELKKRE